MGGGTGVAKMSAAGGEPATPFETARHVKTALRPSKRNKTIHKPRTGCLHQVHCRAAARGARRPLLIGDLPFGSYEGGPRDAVAAGVRMLKEGGMDAVKVEGSRSKEVSMFVMPASP